MSNFQPQYGYGLRPGMGGGPGFNMPGNRPPFMGGQGGYPPMMGGPGMGGPGMGGPGMLQRPIAPFRGGGPPPLIMPRMGGPGMGGFPAVHSPPSGIAPPRATTVYVGKIASSIPDAVVRELLEACGTIRSWNPVKEPSGQRKGFGFCEYEDGEGALRSLRLLNNLKVDGQEMLLKPNTATQKYLVWYEQQKDARRRQKEQEKAEREAKKQEDAEAKAAAGDDDKQESEAAGDKDKASDDEPEVDEAAQEQATDDLALAIIMGIVSGRSTPPPDSGEKARDKDRDQEHDRLPPPPRDDDRHRGPAADLDPEAARERALEVEFERERERRRRNEDEQRRRDEREYQRRLEFWERHEREKDRDRERERDRQKDAERERARFIKADLEARESDDEREPWQRRSLRHHRRTEERRKRRQREMIDDDADRQKEQQELAELEAKQPIEPSHSEASADGIKQEIKQEPEEQSAAVDVDQQPQEQQQQEQKPLVDAKDEIYQAMLAAAAGSAPPSSAASPAHQTQQPVAAPPAIAGPRPTAVMGTSTLARKGRKLAVSALFDDEDEDNTKRRKLVPIKYTDEEMRAVEDHSAAVAAAVAGAAAAAAGQSGGQQQQNDGTVPVYPPGLDFGQRKTFLRQWMDTLPNSREALHAFPIRWQFMNDASLKNISAWVSKKVPELVGMEEPDLVEFIMANVRKQASADTLESELEPILAQDAGSFVMKLKRLIIYECERTALSNM